MQSACDCRQNALALLNISEESAEFRDRAADLARMWLALAALEDLITNLAGPDRDIQYQPECCRPAGSGHYLHLVGRGSSS
jgi:hypothetical protein